MEYLDVGAVEHNSERRREALGAERLEDGGLDLGIGGGSHFGPNLTGIPSDRRVVVGNGWNCWKTSSVALASFVSWPGGFASTLSPTPTGTACARYCRFQQLPPANECGWNFRRSFRSVDLPLPSLEDEQCWLLGE